MPSRIPHRLVRLLLCRLLPILLLLAIATTVATTVVAGPAAAEENPTAEIVRSQYTKFEHRIPMRDGARLFTAVYIPNDALLGDGGTTYPILMFRTPYSVTPYGVDRYRESLGPSTHYPEEGFIFVYQDVRGRFMSEGEFINMRPHLEEKNGPEDVDESTDTYDTIEWLLENIPGHNGKVGQWGVSYPGFYTSAGAIDSHPALAAVSPQAPIADWFWDDMHRHGAFNLVLAFNFFSSFGVAREELTTEWPERFDHETPDAYQFFLDMGPLKNANEKYFEGEIEFWNQVAKHPNYDEFWQSRNILPHLNGITAASMVVGGWYDTEDLYGPLNTYRAIEEQNPDAWNMLVMGPWTHGAWQRSDGDSLNQVDFGFKTAEFYRQNVELPFFRHFLKNADDPALPEAMVFETGANRWRSFDAWPPAGVVEKTLYFHTGGELAWSAPETTGDDAFDEYPSDPAKPVPYTMEITNGWAREYIVEDQRFAARRPDVLVYKTEVLEENVTLAGSILADLFVSTTGDDADFLVKLIDVYPNEMPGDDENANDGGGDDDTPDLGGMQQLVRAEIFRGRFRDSYEEPKPFTPGEVDEVSFILHDAFHTFKRGHRIMVQVQSSWFPFIDRNPQSWVPNIFAADEEDFIKAMHRVYRSAEHPSGVRVKVLP